MSNDTFSFDNIPAEDLLKDASPNQDDSHVDIENPNPPQAENFASLRGWRPAKSLLTLKSQVNAKWPNRSKASDGMIGDNRHCHGGSSASSDHCAHVQDGNVGVVTAFDITHDPSSCNSFTLAEALRQSKDERIKYIISNRRIASSVPVGGHPAWAWRTYGGSDPHTSHVHLSVNANKSGRSGYDDQTNWSAVG